MVDFSNHKQPDMSSFALPFLSDLYLYYLGEKYILDDLKEEINDAVSKKEISDENVLDVAIVAEQSKVHDQFSDKLFDRVGIFLLKKFAGDLDKALEFFSQCEATATPAKGLALMKVMARMKNMTPPLCENCKAYPCMDGMGVTKLNFVAGARVRNVSGKGYSEVDRLNRIIEHMGQFSAVMKDGALQSGWILSPAYYKYKCPQV